jgi:transposase-like protein
MENATIMKVHAKNLNSMTYQLAIEETHAEEHLELLREAIEDFRCLFVDWVKSFDPTDRIDDGWGLYFQ